MRILIVARDMVGDLVNTTGAVLRVRELHPDAHITLEGGPPVAQVFANWPSQLRIWSRKRGGGLPARITRLARMRSGRFDLCLVFDDGHAHARLAKLAGIPVRIGVHRGYPNVYTKSKSFDPGGHDLFETIAFVLSELPVERQLGECPAPRLFASDEDRAKAARIVAKLPPDPIALSVSSTSREKNWPEHRWLDLVHQGSDYNFVFVGAFGDPFLDRLAAGVKGQQVEVVREKLSILEFAEVIRAMRAVVTPDTGTAHIAAAVGTPSVVLYGSTKPHRFHPFRDYIALSTADREVGAWPDREYGCDHYGSGCNHLGSEGCTQLCVGSILPEQVLSALNKLLRAR